MGFPCDPRNATSLRVSLDWRPVPVLEPEGAMPTEPHDVPPGPLTGLTVVECSTWAFGPLCGVMLGDLGADVIKVENPNQPDAGRTLLVVASADMEMPDGRSALFDIVNRNKRSVAIDLKSDGGRDLLKELIAGADVFLQNFRPGVFDRMGLGYDDLAPDLPRLIYARTSGYGLNGDESERPALDPVGQARAGMFYASGEPGDAPNWISFAFADIMGASMLAYGVVAAVAARERYGRGQLVEASHLQASMWLEYWGIGAGLYKGLSDWPRLDRATAANPLFSHYQAADGEWLTLGIIDSTRHWGSFCRVLGLDGLGSDPRFADADGRWENAAALVKLLDARFAQEPRAVWEERLGSDSDLIFDRVQRIGDLPSDPAVVANDYLIDVPHPRYGSVPMIRHPVNLSATPATVRSTAPAHRQLRDDEEGRESEQGQATSPCGSHGCSRPSNRAPEQEDGRLGERLRELGEASPPRIESRTTAGQRDPGYVPGGRPTAELVLQENREGLPVGLLRTAPHLLDGQASDRMIQHREWIVGQPHHPRDVARRHCERRRAENHRSLARLLKRDPVVQTARRATPSIPCRGQEEVAALNRVRDPVRVRRCARVPLLYQLRNPAVVPLDEQRRRLSQQQLCVHLSIREHPDRESLQTRQLGRSGV